MLQVLTFRSLIIARALFDLLWHLNKSLPEAELESRGDPVRAINPVLITTYSCFYSLLAFSKGRAPHVEERKRRGVEVIIISVAMKAMKTNLLQISYTGCSIRNYSSFIVKSDCELRKQRPVVPSCNEPKWFSSGR